MIYCIWYRGPSPDFNAAVEELFKTICYSFEAYDKIAAEILSNKGYDDLIQRDLSRLIHSGRTMVTGWHQWQAESVRYDLQRYIAADGSFTIRF